MDERKITTAPTLGQKLDAALAAARITAGEDSPTIESITFFVPGSELTQSDLDILAEEKRLTAAEEMMRLETRLKDLQDDLNQYAGGQYPYQPYHVSTPQHQPARTATAVDQSALMSQMNAQLWNQHMENVFNAGWAQHQGVIPTQRNQYQQDFARFIGLRGGSDSFGKRVTLTKTQMEGMTTIQLADYLKKHLEYARKEAKSNRQRVARATENVARLHQTTKEWRKSKGEVLPND